MGDFKFTKEQEIWLKALESGEYKQGQGALKLITDHANLSKARYCCLGVACEVLAPDDFSRHYTSCKNTDVKEFVLEHNDHQLELSGEIRALLNLRYDDGEFLKHMWVDKEDLDAYHVYDSLAQMNDSGRFTFKDIAGFIRRNPTLLFFHGHSDV